MLDATDRQLIALLRTEARMPVAKLAAALGVTRATVRARLDRLVTSGIITGFTVTVRDVEPGGVRAVTLIEVDGRHAEGVIRRLSGLPEIRALHTTNGRWDIVAEIEVPTLGDFDALLRTIRQFEGIANSETSILLAARKGG
ncbi:Lrp/AsnC family transcriptional regulator [Methylorubrum extorquens]|uniref:Lrp/AsnC family transcriptional regulator n=1 Tax=Methylorubrum extorquens TaxID=408 RepID=UPI000158F4AA|nr:Lrp/AsnC family transcriptional regulator [Methylorubrum extorquens]ABY31192.1 regulatory protein AsnC/Lrp family [Methylorubrum extorquens PA1]KQP87896.1 AsnC family transcriptional regulator [Methylobacterium sp. Leaf119]WIU37839.1 Lrp/AsnC family transcriptional regulator [Methylorubrum extorquens]